MDLATYRKSQGLTQEQLASLLGLRSKTSISMVESGLRPASLRLALRIEQWSNGEVRAHEVSAEAGALLDSGSPTRGRA